MKSRNQIFLANYLSDLRREFATTNYDGRMEIMKADLDFIDKVLYCLMNDFPLWG